MKIMETKIIEDYRIRTNGEIKILQHENNTYNLIYPVSNKGLD